MLTPGWPARKPPDSYSNPHKKDKEIQKANDEKHCNYMFIFLSSLNWFKKQLLKIIPIQLIILLGLWHLEMLIFFTITAQKGGRSFGGRK